MSKRAIVCLTVIAIAMIASQVGATEEYETADALSNDLVAPPLNTDITLRGPVLYDNGPLVTNPGVGAGGADVSQLLSELPPIGLGENTLGYGHQLTATADFRIADDFTVPGPGWNVDEIRFYAYQSNAGSPSTITGVNLRIWDGDPSNPASGVVFGDTTTNRMSATAYSNINRMSTGNFPLNTARQVMANDVTVGTTLTPGTYWLDWQSTGSASSGPWAPPVSFLDQTNAPGANAMQFNPDPLIGWAPVEDSGSLTPDDFPFIISGTVVPEPGSALLLLLAAGSLLGFRRR